MCIILDANILGKFVKDPEHEDYRPIYEWLERGGRIVYSSGGQFDREIGDDAVNMLSDLARRGLAIHINAKEFSKCEQSVEASGNCKSNDFHILALAKHSGARVLFTKDKNLVKDFKNVRIIAGPRGRGKVYSGKRNSDLLYRSNCQTN